MFLNDGRPSAPLAFATKVLATPWQISFRINVDIKTQPVTTNASEEKSRLRKPPKYEIKAESFQSVQLKPIPKEPKKPQRAENGTMVDLKVSLR